MQRSSVKYLLVLAAASGALLSACGNHVAASSADGVSEGVKAKISEAFPNTKFNRIVYDDETLIDTNEYAQSILECLFGLDITIVCEPGRFLVGNSGVFVSKVLYEKVNGSKRFVIVDGAMNDLIRPALYDAYHKVEVLNDNKELSDCNLVGPVCESGDFFAKNIDLPQTEHNDLVAIYSAGAYCFTMASNYNTRNKVAEIAVENGQNRLIRRRETFEDLIAHEEEFLK